MRVGLILMARLGQATSIIFCCTGGGDCLGTVEAGRWEYSKK